MNFDRCLEITRALFRSDHSERTFHTTFILQRKHILSIGINHANTHPITLKYNYISESGVDIRDRVGIHSELSALLKLGEENTSKYDFLNIRLDKNGNVCYSKPCRGCQHVLSQFGYNRFYYTNEKQGLNNL
jgi:deoxycytidylate deaminase